MLELTDTHPELNVLDSEYQRLLGYPAHHVLEGRSRELADWAKQWYEENGKPWTYARQTDELKLADQRIRIQETEFASGQFHDQLSAAQAHSAVLVAVSAGSQCEEKARELWQEGKPDEYFFLEMYGSAVVEHLIMNTGGRICAWAETNGMMVLPHYSPGYSGWDVTDQVRLLGLIQRNGSRELPGFLHVMDTGMLKPKKSLLAVFGITRHLERVRHFSELVPCHNCSLPGCQYRRAPHQQHLPQIEDVHRLQPGVEQIKVPGVNGTSLLTPDAKYSVNHRALRKWSQERLQLQTLPDGSVAAQFRYEGTTCSNLGRPLEFHYHVTLGRPEEAYPVVEANCVPSPGDTGHTLQCEYLSNPLTFMQQVADEKPLLGKSLNEILTWRRPYSPSGCYCGAEGRTHKWGLALEVIHYALAQRAKGLRNNQRPS